jgi:hypothetical protein
MPRLALEPMIPVFERAKLFRTLGRAATVFSRSKLKSQFQKQVSISVMYNLLK